MSHNPSILVVDDDKGIRETLSKILEQKGCIVETAETGKQAIEASKRSVFNIALVDIRLPDIEGIELLGRLKKTEPKIVKMRIITEKCKLDAFAQETMRLSESYGNPVEIRQLEELQFNSLIIDNKEAMWGERASKNKKKNLWTNDPTQISILKMSFENLWQKATKSTKD